VVKPVVRREVAGHLQRAYGISERRACSATGFQRCEERYRKRSDPQIELRLRLKELAAARVRYGYRRVAHSLAPGGLVHQPQALLSALA
jgi:putative transposase